LYFLFFYGYIDTSTSQGKEKKMAKKLPTDIDHLIMELEMDAVEGLAVYWGGGSESFRKEAIEALRFRCDLTGERFPSLLKAADEAARELVKEMA
jgi:hypothetical protein